MSEIKKTITRIFMVPTLRTPDISSQQWKELLDENGFLNGYARDEMRDVNYDDAAYLLFRPKNLDRFREFLDGEYEKAKGVIEDYDHPDGFVVVVYKLNPKYKADFDLVRKSKYSKTSSEFQNLFPKVIKIQVGGLSRDEISLQVRIFRKTSDLKRIWEDEFGEDIPDNIELWDGYHIEKETLTKDKLEQYLKQGELV